MTLNEDTQLSLGSLIRHWNLLIENLHENKRILKMRLNESSNPMIKDEPIVRFWIGYDGVEIIYDLDTASNAYSRIIDILNSNPKFIKEYDLLDIGIIDLDLDKNKDIVNGDWLLWCNPADDDLEDIEDDEDYLDTIINGNWDWAVEDLKNLLK